MQHEEEEKVKLLVKELHYKFSSATAIKTHKQFRDDMSAISHKTKCLSSNDYLCVVIDDY